MMHEYVDPINRKTIHARTLSTEKLHTSSASDRDQLGVPGPAKARKHKKTNFLKHYEKYGHGPP